MDLTARVEEYRRATTLVDGALTGITDSELDAQPAGAWSARMVIHHLADSETNSYVRLRRLLAEPPGTTMQGYDEGEWARMLHYDRPIKASLAVFRAVRAASAELLERCSDGDLTREGVHTESGPYTVDDWLRVYTAHAVDHAGQITRARAGMA